MITLMRPIVDWHELIVSSRRIKTCFIPAIGKFSVADWYTTDRSYTHVDPSQQLDQLPRVVGSCGQIIHPLVASSCKDDISLPLSTSAAAFVLLRVFMEKHRSRALTSVKAVSPSYSPFMNISSTDFVTKKDLTNQINILTRTRKWFNYTRMHSL